MKAAGNVRVDSTAGRRRAVHHVGEDPNYVVATQATCTWLPGGMRTIADHILVYDETDIETDGEG